MNIIIQDTLVSYDTFGSGPNILFVHGWGHSKKAWVRSTQEISKHFTVTILDLPGHGESQTLSQPQGIQWFTDIVSEFLAKAQMENTIYVGHSLGGRIGIILASQYPKLFSQLVLVNPGGVEEKSKKVLRKIWIYKTIIKPLKKIPLLSGAIIKMRSGSNDYNQATQTMRTTLIKIVNQDLQNFAKSIKTPTTIIWGERDAQLPFWHAKRLKYLIKNSKLRIVWGADHSPHITKSSDFTATLLEEI
jgi:pimeloyl-ACP methyl ester carboxylesterase